MLRSYRAWLAGALVLCAASILCAQATVDRYANPPAEPATETAGWAEPAADEAPAGPPAWNDGASVYLAERATTSEQSSAEGATDHYGDPRVTTAAYEQESQAVPRPPTEPGRIAPPGRALRPTAKESTATADSTSGWGLPIDSLVTTITALVLVIGLFLLCAWALRRGSRQLSGALPKDVVSVLGTTPLGGRQLAQLLRLGNKLVLVSVTTGGAETLAEVTDPAEVERLLGLCLQSGPRDLARTDAAKMAGLIGTSDTTPNFDTAYRQLAPAPTLRELSGLDVPLAKTPALGDLFRSYQGGGERA
jgi:flagellar biogenesis protein FliO